MDNFIGTYIDTFWAGEKIKLEEIEKLRVSDYEEAKDGFRRQMSQEAFAYETDRYKFKVYKDGLLLIHAKQHQGLLGVDYGKWFLIHLEYFNCISILFQSAYHKYFERFPYRTSEITLNQALPFTEKGEIALAGVPILSMESEYHGYRHLPDYETKEPLEEDYRLDREEIPKEVFDTLNGYLEKASNDDSNLKILAQLNRSLAQYNIYNHSTALVLAWFVIEQYLNLYWERYIDQKNVTYPDGTKRVSSKRLELLIGKDYTASIVSNMLELIDILDINIFRKIDSVRKVRNAIAHKNVEAESNHCKEAYEVIKYFAEKEMNIELNIKPSHTFEFAKKFKPPS